MPFPAPDPVWKTRAVPKGSSESLKFVRAGLVRDVGVAVAGPNPRGAVAVTSGLVRDVDREAEEARGRSLRGARDVKQRRRSGSDKVPAQKKKDPHVEFGSLEDSIFFELRRAQWLVFQSLERRQVDRVTPGQATILALVARNAGISQIDLARAVSIERSSLGEIVERLESMGLLRRAHSAHDRRAWALELTEPGRQVVVESLARAADHERYLETFLSGQESKSLVRLLKKLSRALAEELRQHDAAEERRGRNGGAARPRSATGG